MLSICVDSSQQVIAFLLKQSNIAKQGGTAYVVVLRMVFGLVFTGGNLFPCPGSRLIRLKGVGLVFSSKRRNRLGGGIPSRFLFGAKKENERSLRPACHNRPLMV